MMPVHSAWLAAHGKLWYDDKWYRIAWLAWPQALAAVVLLWFWVMPSNSKSAQWARPVDAATRSSQLLALRDRAKSSKPDMDTLERDARGGEASAQFFFATLFDPDFKLSTIVQPDVNQALEWYGKAANQGDETSPEQSCADLLPRKSTPASITPGPVTTRASLARTHLRTA